METMKISCPKCKAIIDLNEAVQEDWIRALREQAEQSAGENSRLELEDLRRQVKRKNDQLKKAQEQELDLREKERTLEEKQENIELEIQRQLDEERQRIVRETREKIDDEHRLKIEEYRKQLDDVNRELENARRKAEQGSQQGQGEIAELGLEDALKGGFPFDVITPVGKGVKGADIHQRVQTAAGEYCGLIIWESKNTKNWSDRWLSKLKEDQLAAKADIAVIVSTVLPEDVSTFASIDGIWVTGFPYTMGLAVALRDTLTLVAQARRTLEGKDEKIERLYGYLSGSEFRQRIEMIVKTFVDMKAGLETEKRAMNKLWSQRDRDIEKVTMNVSGMYGDLHSIVGAALPTIQALELPGSVDEESPERV